MRTAAAGFRVHSGWCAMVALTLEDGRPEILFRGRLQLVEIFDYQFRQPYHTAVEMDGTKRRDFISQIRKTAENLASREVRRVQAELADRKIRLRTCGMLASSARPLPRLEKILASHPLLHTADGELFRDALMAAARRCKLSVLPVKEKEVMSEAAKAIGLTPAALRKRAKDLGRGLGAPWTQDQQYAALAAWIALSNRRKPR